MGDGHHPNNMVLYTNYKDSYFSGGRSPIPQKTRLLTMAHMKKSRFVDIFCLSRSSNDMTTWLFQLDDSKPLLGKWLEITKHPLKNGCLGFQVYVLKRKNLRYILPKTNSIHSSENRPKLPQKGKIYFDAKEKTM